MGEGDNKRDPQTPAEWREAVDSASFCIYLHSAQCYGLVTGDPNNINVDRCEEILRRGAAQGIHPRPIEVLCMEFIT